MPFSKDNIWLVDRKKIYASTNIRVIIIQIFLFSDIQCIKLHRLPKLSLNIQFQPVSAESTLSVAVKPKRKTPLPPLQFVHTLNATACAVPKMIISILENFQQEDGFVIVPEVLKPFMVGVEVIYPKSKQ